MPHPARQATPRQPDGPTPSADVAEVNGTRLAYEIRGAGHPLVLLHAGIADAGMWDDQIDAFAERFLVVRYDARGFGRSGPADGAYAPHADLAALLAALGIGRAHLLGLSMGGGVALDAALAYPRLATALVLAATRPGGLAPSKALRDAWTAVDARVAAGDVAGAVELELRMWVDGPRRAPSQIDPTVRERVRRMNAPLFAVPEEGTPLPLDPLAVERLGEIAVPTLVLVGELDQPDVLAGAEALSSGIPAAQRAVIQETAHVPNMERPTEFNRRVLDFLAGVDAPLARPVAESGV